MPSSPSSRLYWCLVLIWRLCLLFLWLLAQKPWIVPIPGTRRVERLDENLGAATIELTADDLGEIERAAAQIQVQGARYPEHLQRLIDR